MVLVGKQRNNSPFCSSNNDKDAVWKDGLYFFLFFYSVSQGSSRQHIGDPCAIATDWQS
jgi:hypothetical protein